MYYQQYRANKYGAKKTTYNGQRYDSKFEADCATELDLRLKAGELVEVKSQVKIDLRAYGKHITYYYIDFVATRADGTKEYIEAKGYATDVWKMKWKMLEAKLAEEEPDSVMILLKQRTFKRYK